MAITVQSRKRVFPDSHTPSQLKVESLSITDAFVLHFAQSACVWFYEEFIDTDRLLSSLCKTLNSYPQWAGQLRFAEYNPDAGHEHRQGRLELSYGSSFDPGVESIFAIADSPMSSVLPPDQTAKHWTATGIDCSEFLDVQPKFALHDSIEYSGLPSMKVQFTRFEDGGVAIAVGIVHSLADAGALLTFVKDWAATNLALSNSRPIPMLQPLFNPSLIDTAAAGDIHAKSPDPFILKAVADLPVHRFDLWASAGPSIPGWAISLTQIPPELASISKDIQLGKPAPFTTWDSTAPCSHVTFFFSAAETHAIYLHAAAHTQTRISHQDAILAHLWAALIRARGLQAGEEHFIDISIDGRRRLQKPLPQSFLGSPIFNAGVCTKVPYLTNSSSRESRTKDVADKAAAIRDTVARFDAETVAALLHEMCFELGGQRRWNCFLGDRHTIVTSWIGVGMREVMFEEGKKVKWAEAILPPCDGVVFVVEGGGSADGEIGKKEWWCQGVHINIYLRSDVMRKLMEDEVLREFAD